MDEITTRLAPWEQIEITWAHNRPHHERPPLPQVGDRVYYRHDEWSTDVQLVVVLEVQDADDRTDPNLWRPVRDIHGQHLIDHVRGVDIPRMAQVADPWPWIGFRRSPDSTRMTYAREARLRGSAGWLPPDWRARPERWRLPAQTMLVPRPPLPPLNVPPGTATGV